jgi:uncharacterized protein (TIGR00661 family)
MARILYGVHGTGHGHAIRALTIARQFSQHDFVFVSHSHGRELLEPECEVVECHNPETPVSGHRVAAAAAIYSSLRVRRNRRGLTRRILNLIDRWQPDVAITDYEYFVPLACRKVGLPCLSLDHQHVVTSCSHRIPLGQVPSYITTSMAIKKMFSVATDYLVTSFYRPPLKPETQTMVLPPLLRASVLERSPRRGDYVLAYHGYSTFKNFFKFLRSIPRRVVIYGSNLDRIDGNLHFKKNSEQGFLRDLANCRYVVCGGGHTLISEALYYGKPLIVFPIKRAFEQYLNAHYVKVSGYGTLHTGHNPPSGIIRAFEARLDQYGENIHRENFCGNKEIFTLLDRYIGQAGRGQWWADRSDPAAGGAVDEALASRRPSSLA